MKNEGFIFLTSSLISTIITHPFDLLKVRSQTLDINIFNKNIIKKLYSGLGYNLQTRPIFWGITYGLKNNKLSDNKYLNLYISANIASLIANPLFVLKTLRESDIETKLNLNNAFSGYFITAIRNSKICFEISMIEYLKDNIINTENYSINLGLSAFIIKTISNLIIYPLDTLASLKRVNKNIFPLKISKLYSGFVYYSIYSVLNYSLMFLIADNISKVINKKMKY